MEPNRLSARTFMPAALTLITASMYVTVRSHRGRWLISIQVVVLAAATPLIVLAYGTRGLGMLAACIGLAALIVPVACAAILTTNHLLPNRRVWVDAGGRAVLTAHITPITMTPKNASARPVSSKIAAPLLQQACDYANTRGLAIEALAQNATVAALYCKRYGFEIVAAERGKFRVRRDVTPGYLLP